MDIIRFMTDVFAGLLSFLALGAMYFGFLKGTAWIIAAGFVMLLAGVCLAIYMAMNRDYA